MVDHVLAQSAPEAPHLENSPTRHPFTFTGSGIEYFQIWLVNFALTVMTLGIYGAWAKVRREQYFHSHTFLAGASFEYTANPISILKGRLLLFVFIAVFVILNTVLPVISVILLFVAFFAFPWVVTQSLKFRARYTSYRNIPFQFIGSYGLSFKYFILTRVIGILSFGALFPWAKHRERKYVVTGMRYGKSPFFFNAKVWDFYKVYLGIFIFALLPLLASIGVVLTVIFTSVFSTEMLQFLQQDPEAAQKAIAESIISQGYWVAFLVVFFLVLTAQIVIPFITRTLIARVTWNNSSLGYFAISYTISLFGYLWIAVSNVFLRLLTFGFASPFCTVRMYRYKIVNLSLWGPDSLGSFSAPSQQELNAFGDEVSDAYDLDIDLGF